MSATIEEAMISKIRALTSLAMDRVYRERIEQAPTLPAIAVTRAGGAGRARPVDTGVPLLQNASLRVEILSLAVADAMEIAQALAAGLDGFRGAIAVGGDTVTVKQCSLRSQLEASAVVGEGDLTLRLTQQDYELIYQ